MGIFDRAEKKLEVLKYAKQYLDDNFKEKNYDFMMEHISDKCDDEDLSFIDTASVLDESAKHYNHIMRNR